MKKILLLLIPTLFQLSSYSRILEDSVVWKVEDYLIDSELDSAKLMVEDMGDDTPKYLKNLALKNEITYSSLSRLMESQLGKQNTNFDGLNKYVSMHLKVPKGAIINDNYVDLVFTHITNLRNNNQLPEADSMNNAFEQYIQLFNQEDKAVQRAIAYKNVHNLVLSSIQNNADEAEKYGNEILSIGRDISDTSLIIMGHFFLYDAYAIKRDLDASINAAEEAYRLEQLLDNRTKYYYENLFHLIDLYDYLDETSEKILPLLKELYFNNSTKNKSYELLCRHLQALKNYPEKRAKVLDMIGVKDILEFAEKAKEDVDRALFEYDQIYFYKELAFLLKSYEYYVESNTAVYKALELTKRLYSEDLSKSLADYQTNLVRREKELEVAYEKRQSKLYILIALLSIGLLCIAIYAFYKKNTQATELAQKSEALEVALHEKQLLLKEVHHRVKNNFQIISSLLELQSKGIEDEKAKELAEEGKNRVKSMALIHQKLYQNDDLLIHFSDYIQKLVAEISQMYGQGNNTKMEYEVGNSSFDIDTAIPLGLIVNELITNAFKYGSSEDASKVVVSLLEKDDDHFELSVKDNGPGMPEGFELKKAKSLGLRLVNSLSKQLHGTFTYTKMEGALFTVIFKTTEARNRVE